MISQGLRSGEGGRRRRGALGAEPTAPSSIGERGDSTVTESARRPAETVQLVATPLQSVPSPPATIEPMIDGFFKLGSDGNRSAAVTTSMEIWTEGGWRRRRRRRRMGACDRRRAISDFSTGPVYENRKILYIISAEKLIYFKRLRWKCENLTLQEKEKKRKKEP